jgi:ATP-dependent Lon protease
VGGEILLVEASKMEGDGELVLTGHLGDVMKESAKLALNWVRTSARQVRH